MTGDSGLPFDLPAVATKKLTVAFDGGGPRWLYDVVCCERGNAENLIKLHKAQLASDRTSCSSARANQVRLVLHAVRAAIPKSHPLACAELAAIRLKLMKIAARVVEQAVSIRVFLPAACPGQALFWHLARALMPRAP